MDDGCRLGCTLGCDDGFMDGCTVGCIDGRLDGCELGSALGFPYEMTEDIKSSGWVSWRY